MLYLCWVCLKLKLINFHSKVQAEALKFFKSMQLGCSAVVGLLACQFGCGFVGSWMLLYCLVYFSGKNRNEVEERERVGEEEREMINKLIEFEK